MIARIVIGSGKGRESYDIPCSTNRKEHVAKRIAFGNILKSNYLWPQGKGFKSAKARGAAAVAAFG